MSAPPMDDSPRPPSYRDLLVERAERPRATRPTFRGIVDFCVSVVVTGGFAVVLGTRLYEKWAQSRSTSGFQRADWFWLVTRVGYSRVGFAIHCADPASRARPSQERQRSNCIRPEPNNACQKWLMGYVRFKRCPRYKISRCLYG
jgi:hypothetical protein